MIWLNPRVPTSTLSKAIILNGDFVIRMFPLEVPLEHTPFTPQFTSRNATADPFSRSLAWHLAAALTKTKPATIFLLICRPKANSPLTKTPIAFKFKKVTL